MKKRILIFACIALILTGCGREDYLRVASAEEQVDKTEEGLLDDEEIPETIFIQLTGKVLRPGVYEVRRGARLYEAIELSGGLLEDAAKEINQVQILEDGQLIHIPSEEEFFEQEKRLQEESDGLIDLNTASVAELSSLPGIGESKANQIITYRDSNGGFSEKEDLMKVPGIKEGTYRKLEEYVTVR